MLIRPFDSSEAASLNAVAIAAFAQYSGVFSEWDALARSVGSMSALAEHAQILVAEDEGQLVGAVAYCAPNSAPRAEFFDSDWSIIRMLVVDPNARRGGVGRRLTEACVQRARLDGASVIGLHTSPVMEVALALYLKMGFELEKRVPDRLGVPYAVYIMRLG